MLINSMDYIRYIGGNNNNNRNNNKKKSSNALQTKALNLWGHFLFACCFLLGYLLAANTHMHTHTHSHSHTHSLSHTRQQSAVIKLNACVNNNTKQKRHLLNVRTKLLRQKVCYKKDQRARSAYENCMHRVVILWHYYSVTTAIIQLCAINLQKL